MTFKKNNKINFKHGESGTRIHNIWLHMRDRCMNKNNKSFKYYGEKGVKVCPEWGAYLNFKKWAVEKGYAKGLEIDRIDNDGDYSPENCRVVTHAINCRNKNNGKLKKDDVLIIRDTYRNGSMSQKDIGKMFGVCQATIKEIVNNEIWIFQANKNSLLAALEVHRLAGKRIN